MATPYAALADLLTETLGLAWPPVALTVVEDAPAGVAPARGEVPSACSFWRRAEQGRFYADAASHGNCLVGAHVMGIPLSAEQGQELMGLVGQMGAAEYLEGEEVANIPTLPGPTRGVVYGPLAQVEGAPDAVVLWLTPAQAMRLEEATGATRWTGAPGIATFGRPSCAAIPAALQRRQPTLSLGCAGMRIFTGVPADRLLAVLPGASLDALAAGLARMHRANQAMEPFYHEQKAAHTRG